MTDQDMATRYRRARQELPPVAARRTAGNAIDGYWLDDRWYFYLAEALDPTLDRVLDTPTLLDAATGATRELITPGTLSALLVAHGFEGSLVDLADAHYDLPTRDRLAVTLGARSWLVDWQARAVVGEETATAPALHSPDGRSAVILDGHDIALLDRATGATRRLTDRGVVDAPVGQQSQTGTSPLTYRRRPSPLGFWSADSRWFVTHQIDERGLDETTLVEPAPATGHAPIAHRFKAPRPYGPLPRVTILAIEVATGRTVAAAPFEMTVYAPVTQRGVWFAAPDLLCYVVSDRHARHYRLMALDLATGEERELLHETTDYGYLELHPLIGWPPNVRVLPDSGEAIWWSERDGWGHLYLYDTTTGAVKNRITEGSWQVRDIVHVDVARRRVLFTMCGHEGGGAYQNRRLCGIDLDGSRLEVLVERPGHDVAVRPAPFGGQGQEWPFRRSFAPPCVAPAGAQVVVRHTHLTEGNRTELVTLGTGAGIDLAQGDPAFADWPVPPRQFDLLAADGTTPIRAALYLPSDFDPARRYPLLDLFYPGPQLVFLPRTANGRIGFLAQAIAELGIAVLISDSRALPFRARALHQAGYPDTAEPQLADQAAVVAQLCRDHAFLDPARVGVLGFSAGGAGAARALLDYPDTFQVGVAINGSYDPRCLIAIWANKYIGPDLAAAEQQDVAAHVDRLRGQLLLVAGGMDENVNIASTLRLADAFVRANKDFELLIVPGQGHVMMLNDGYTVRRVFDFLVRTLLHAAPPGGMDFSIAPDQLARMAKANALDALWM